MMMIRFSPIRSDMALALECRGDVLLVNGVAQDFGALAEGAVLARDSIGGDWLASDVTRVAGVVHLTVILPHAADAGPERLFPAPCQMAGDGPVPLPGA